MSAMLELVVGVVLMLAFGVGALWLIGHSGDDEDEIIGLVTANRDRIESWIDGNGDGGGVT